MSDETIRPDTKEFLEALEAFAFPAIETQTPEAARSSLLASLDFVDLPMGELATVKELTIPGPAGDIPALLLDPRATRGAGPVLIWLHGGGFVTGSVATHRSLCADVARQLDLPIVVVDYRLAPEAPFPAAQDDAESSARWVAANPPQLQRPVTGLVLAGDSAGGTLTIVTTMALRDRPAEVPVLAHLVIYPAVDETRTYPSAERFARGYLLTEGGRTWYREHYRPVPTDPRASPLLGDLAGMPPAVVLTSGLDPVRDQGRAYAAKLASSGVSTVWQEAVGNIHAFVLLRKAIPSSSTDIAAALGALKAVLSSTQAAAPS